MIIAWTALILWPIACIVFYQKMKLPTAFCITIVGGYLLLPENVNWDLPLLPALDKTSIPTLTALVLTAITLASQPRKYPVMSGWMPRNRVVLCLMGMMLIGSFGTALNNADFLFYGPVAIRGLQLYDGFSIVLGLLITLIPFLLARKVLATPESQQTLMIVLVVAAMIYSIPALYEVRMSPTLNLMIYGFYPSAFFQAVRDGGFRPSVFLLHGLELSIFMTIAIIATAGMFRIAKIAPRGKWIISAIWLLGTLILCKSLGALIIAVILLPVAVMFRPRTQLLVAACISGMVLVYPTLRAADVVPVHEFLAYLEPRNPARAQSFGTRIFNEDILLEKARERPVFGWGTSGRPRVYNEFGRDVSITDGAWIIEFGVGGWVRYLAIFGLLCWPCIALFLGKRDKIDPTCALLALLLTAKLIDLIPNTGLQPFVWMMAGSLIGRLEMQESVTKHGPEIPQTLRNKIRVAAHESTPGLKGFYRATRYTKEQEDIASAGEATPKPSRYSRGQARPGYRR